MTMTAATPELAVQTLDLVRETMVDAPVEVTFEAVLAALGPEGQMPGGTPFPFKLDPWPGGRWFRDLGDGAGHLWGHVQVIKPPALLELCGPMFVSFPATNHVQYRLTGDGNGGTLLKFTHRAFGYMPKEFMQGVEQGWDFGLNRIREIARRLKSERR